MPSPDEKVRVPKDSSAAFGGAAGGNGGGEIRPKASGAPPGQFSQAKVVNHLEETPHIGVGAGEPGRAAGFAIVPRG